jgi:hypothetical protein
MSFSDEQERTMRNQETTIVLDSISSQSKAETTDTHIELRVRPETLSRIA